jgi:hypothetical protein
MVGTSQEGYEKQISVIRSTSDLGRLNLTQHFFTEAVVCLPSPQSLFATLHFTGSTVVFKALWNDISLGNWRGIGDTRGFWAGMSFCPLSERVSPLLSFRPLLIALRSCLPCCRFVLC